MNIIDFIKSYFLAIGSIIITFQMIPQIIKIYKTKVALDISYSMSILTITALIFLAFYGFYTNQMQMWLASLVQIFLNIFLIVLKYHYDKQNIIKPDINHLGSVSSFPTTFTIEKPQDKVEIDVLSD